MSSMAHESIYSRFPSTMVTVQPALRKISETVLVSYSMNATAHRHRGMHAIKIKIFISSIAVLAQTVDQDQNQS